MGSITTDLLVIGGGIVGVTVAAELKRRQPDSQVMLLEKESRCGLHASGRNSGVLHAGFYYTANSLKARFSRDGNKELTEYCLARRLRINRCGKLVVPRCQEEVSVLDELVRRARANGVDVELLGPDDASRLEPQIRPGVEALYSPNTATVDPPEVMASLVSDAVAAGVQVRRGIAYRQLRGNQIVTSHGRLTAGYVVNAAGLYADRVARHFGFSARHRILPFRGLYLHYQGAGPVPRHHLYPVPMLDHPFLGVHWTITADGHAKIGPTATPALWREHYQGVSNFDAAEVIEIGRRESGLMLRNSFGFRRLAWQEVQKYSRRRLVAFARELTRDSAAVGPWRWGDAGVRAQLIDTRSRSLESDFHLEGDDRSFHILNAVSPAFTCALPFARYVADEIESQMIRGTFGGRAEEKASTRTGAAQPYRRSTCDQNSLGGQP